MSALPPGPLEDVCKVGSRGQRTRVAGIRWTKGKEGCDGHPFLANNHFALYYGGKRSLGTVLPILQILPEADTLKNSL
ncbi:MAG TPA: hypothetical protein DCP92_03930 [Nitrospiraceae bacterium]|nr:hypothetical protein [Nitrospiraceae bacterium]